MLKPTFIASKTEACSFLSKYNTFLFDCDGVLWLQSDVIPGAVETIHQLRENKKNVYFLSNNSFRSRESYVKKFASLGFKGITKDLIISSSYAVAQYVKDNVVSSKENKVYVIGGEGILQEFEELEIDYVTTPNLQDGVEPENWCKFKKDSAVNVVVVGGDWFFNYRKMIEATGYLCDSKVAFISTNLDKYYPNPDFPDRLVPGTYSIIQAIENCVNRQSFSVGKPNSYFYEILKKRFKFEDDSVLMVGDTLHTDICFGNNVGIATLLVMTGNDGQNKIEKALDDKLYNEIPQFVAPSIEVLKM